MAATISQTRPEAAQRMRGTGHGWAHAYLQRLEMLNSSCIVDPDFDEDANDDPLTGEPLDQSVYNTGRPQYYAVA